VVATSRSGWVSDRDFSGAAVTSRIRLPAAYRISRPDQVLLILVVYAVGCAAGAGGEVTVDWGSLLDDAVFVGLVIAVVTVSVHAVNEYADAETDALTVRTRFSGGSGALIDHGLPAGFALRIAVGAAAVAVTLGWVGWTSGRIAGVVLTMLVLMLVGGWTYSVGPWAFSRHGWGEVANALLGGLLLPVTGALVVGAPLGTALAAFGPFTLLVFVNLLETQWADRVADRAVGKNTLASRLSPDSIRLLGGAAAVAAYVLALVSQPLQVALAGLFAAPVSAYGVRRLGRGDPGPSVVAMIVLLFSQGAAWLA